MNDTLAEEYMLYAHTLAQKAAKIMKHYYYGDYEKKLKGNNTPVTVADTEINSMVIENIKRDFPDDGVLGEEESWQSDASILWVCDPIDGTTAYIVHLPTSVFSLAIVVDGVAYAAIVINPWTGDVYTAKKGQGAYRNKQKINVSNRKWPKVCLSTSGVGSKNTDSLQARVMTDFSSQVSVTHFSGVVFQGCLIAEGALDGRIFFHDGAHDVASTKIIVEEAGGKVTDIDGNNQLYNQPINGAIVSNGNIHKELIEKVKKHANSGD